MHKKRDKYYINLGWNIQRIRREKGMKRPEVAQQLGVHKSVYEKYEIGKIRILPDTLSKLAGIFEVQEQDFFEENPGVRKITSKDRYRLNAFETFMALPDEKVSKQLFFFLQTLVIRWPKGKESSQKK